MEYMEIALAEARLALAEGEVPVGCVVVSAEGRLVAKGRNATHRTGDATAHAELVAFRCMQKYYAPDDDSLTELTLYVTCEPCIMCAAAIIQTKLFSKVIFGCANSRFGGCGSVRPLELNANISNLPAVQSGVRADEALELLVRFYNTQNPYAPKPKPRRNSGRDVDHTLQQEPSLDKQGVCDGPVHDCIVVERGSTSTEAILDN